MQTVHLVIIIHKLTCQNLHILYIVAGGSSLYSSFPSYQQHNFNIVFRNLHTPQQAMDTMDCLYFFTLNLN
jgi:hypothetical protein